MQMQLSRSGVHRHLVSLFAQAEELSYCLYLLVLASRADEHPRNDVPTLATPAVEFMWVGPDLNEHLIHESTNRY